MICDIEGCGQPAMYGDGVTWNLCSKHNYERGNVKIEAQPEKPITGEGFPHQTIPGMTSIIIPVYINSYPIFHMTGNCIGSIRYFTNMPYEIIIVDNGSTIKQGKMEDWKAEKIVTVDTNIGYTKAVNRGIKVAFGEYIAIVTNDTQVYEGWLDDAKEALNHIDFVYAKPMYGEPYARALEAQHYRESWLSRPIEESLNNDLLDGACVVTTKKLFDEIGLYDERFVNYAADSDLFRRMDKAGKKYAGCERMRIHHIIGATSLGMNEAAEMMDKDKKEFEVKWQGSV